MDQCTESFGFYENPVMIQTKKGNYEKDLRNNDMLQQVLLSVAGEKGLEKICLEVKGQKDLDKDGSIFVK